jgi:hypothetical protein
MTKAKTSSEQALGGVAAIMVWISGLLAVACVAILGGMLVMNLVAHASLDLVVPISVGLGCTVVMGLLVLPLTRR